MPPRGGLFESPLRHQRFPRSQAWGFRFLCRMANGLFAGAFGAGEKRCLLPAGIGDSRALCTTRANRSLVSFSRLILGRRCRFALMIHACSVATKPSIPQRDSSASCTRAGG